ncbi:MobA/MobL family protein [Psychrobacter ciconiae]|uniref:MobA/MobL family protein n=1 Tax=Psychrobacter ciconiae TaxID=1553449 RepID=UPI00166095E3|nr:MobA/MobL family protein [Psychrobacter ciconiae]
MNIEGFHVGVSPVTRGREHSVVAKSAYNSGSKLRDERAGCVHDYSSKSREKKVQLIDDKKQESEKVIEKNVVFSTLILPKEAAGIAVDREQFWNDIEAVEKSKRAQLGTEIEVMFPHGLDADQRIVLIEKYCQHLADRYNVLVDVSIHNPHTHLQTKADKNGKVIEINEVTKDNHHAHILLSSREILPNADGSYRLSKRKNWSLWATSERLSKGMTGRGDELAFQRRLWRECNNEMLPEEQHISEKSYREQGVNRLPKMKMGKSLYRDFLKGKRSAISEYNELIDEINDYIEKHNLIIDYGNDRIDLEENIQEFRGVKVAYKKRKPYYGIDINKITLRPANNALTQQKRPVYSLSDIKNMGADIKKRHQNERSGLLSTAKAVEQQLKNQKDDATRAMEIYKKLPKLTQNLGLNWDDDINRMVDQINLIKTQDELLTVSQIESSLDKLAQNPLQHTAHFGRLKSDLDKIADQLQKNEVTLEKISNQHTPIATTFNQIQSLKERVDKKLSGIEKALKKTNDLVLEKEICADRWHDIFYKLVDIKVTDNLKTYQKFKTLSSYDLDALNGLENDYKKFTLMKAANITDQTQKDMDTLMSAIQSYQDQTKTDLAAVTKQLKTSNNDYLRLEPLYTKRQNLLDSRAPVIEQDDELYHEITSTKTTQLRADKIDDWQKRVDLLQEALIAAHKQAQLEKRRAQQQAEKDRQDELERQAKLKKQAEDAYKAEQIKAYQNRLTNFKDRISAAITQLDFNGIDAPKPLIACAERLTQAAMLLDGLRHIKKLTSSIQHDLNKTEEENATKLVNDHLKSFIDQLDKQQSNQQTLNLIVQLSSRFDEVLKLQPSNAAFNALQPKLEARQNSIQQKIDRAYSYSSPSP